jgi:hypothetical protein
MSDNRTARKSSARLSSTGYLRLSSDLVPPKEKSFAFILTPLPEQRQLVLRIVSNHSRVHTATRRAQYANPASRCPLVTVKAAMQFMGIRLPKKSQEFPVRKRKDVLTVQF